MKHLAILALTPAAAIVLAGCAGSLPDGNHIDRLSPDRAAALPELTPEQRSRLEQLNAQVMAEQNAARARDAQLDAARQAQLQWEMDYGPWWWGPQPWIWWDWDWGRHRHR